MVRLYHGGKAGLRLGDAIVPAEPHVEDGCPICAARATDRRFTVGQFRLWALEQGEAGRPLLRFLEGQAADAAVDGPRGEPERVYVSTDRDYARFYAARSGGDLYVVTPAGPLVRSGEDHFETYTVERAIVAEVVERGVYLKRGDRRQLMRRWKKADRAVEKGR